MDTKGKTRRRRTRLGKRSSMEEKRSNALKRKRQNFERKTAGARTTARRAQRAESADVVYTDPQPVSRNRLLLRLITVVAVVLALTFGISIFFKVKTITVSGAKKYTAWAVREASGIAEGDSLLSFGKAKACGRITAAMPYVDSVRIGIKLPDTVNIEIKEIDIVYSVRDQDDNWWLISAAGEAVERANNAVAGNYTRIEGVRLAIPEEGKKVTAYEMAVAATNPEGVTAPETVKASERLSAALTIVDQLERNGIIGEVVSVDVSDYGNIELWYGTQYQVQLGDATQLAYKIGAMKKAISQLDNYHSGVLDVSFKFWEDQVGYTPFT